LSGQQQMRGTLIASTVTRWSRSHAIPFQSDESHDPRVHVNHRAAHCNRRAMHQALEEAERRLKLIDACR
jgi:hypothetical protein